jgi:hypothetical protein
MMSLLPAYVVAWSAPDHQHVRAVLVSAAEALNAARISTDALAISSATVPQE